MQVPRQQACFCSRCHCLLGPSFKTKSRGAETSVTRRAINRPSGHGVGAPSIGNLQLNIPARATSAPILIPSTPSLEVELGICDDAASLSGNSTKSQKRRKKKLVPERGNQTPSPSDQIPRAWEARLEEQTLKADDLELRLRAALEENLHLESALRKAAATEAEGLVAETLKVDCERNQTQGEFAEQHILVGDTHEPFLQGTDAGDLIQMAKKFNQMRWAYEARLNAVGRLEDHARRLADQEQRQQLRAAEIEKSRAGFIAEADRAADKRWTPVVAQLRQQLEKKESIIRQMTETGPVAPMASENEQLKQRLAVNSEVLSRAESRSLGAEHMLQRTMTQLQSSKNREKALIQQLQEAQHKVATWVKMLGTLGVVVDEASNFSEQLVTSIQTAETARVSNGSTDIAVKTLLKESLNECVSPKTGGTPPVGKNAAAAWQE